MTRRAASFFIFSFFCSGIFASFPEFPQGVVTDQAHVLDSATTIRLERLLSELKQKTSHEVAVVTVASLEGLDIEGAAAHLFKTWGIGAATKDNGILFLIAPSDRKVRIEVGYGLEGVIPDGLAGRILDSSVIPRFRENKISEGIFAGANHIAHILAVNAGVVLSPEFQGRFDDQGKQKQIPLPIFVVIIVIFAAVVIKNPWILWLFLSSHHRGRGRWSSGGFGGFGGGFGGFGGGMSGGGGSSRGW